MTVGGWLQIALLLAVLTPLTPVLGGYIDRVFKGERVLLARALGPAERRLIRLLAGPEPAGQDWKEYAVRTVIFSAVGFLALYVIVRT